MLFTDYLREEKNIEDINKVDKEIVEEYITFTKERRKYSFVADDGYLKANIDKRKDIGNEVSISTLNNYLRNIKVFFTYLEENNIIKENTVKNCKFIKMQRTSKEQLTDEEYKRLIKSLDITKFHEYRDYIIIQLIFYTGMRINETLNLSIYDIDLLRKTIYIPSEITKGKKDRGVFLVNLCVNYYKDGLDLKIVCSKRNYCFQLKGLMEYYQYQILREILEFI